MTKTTPPVTADFPPYTIGEEIANSILHGIGVLAAIAGLVLLSLKTRGFFGETRGDSADITAVLVFTAAMIAMFLASTLYHSIRHQGAKRILKKIDHSMVYIFIAGTYTPFCLIALKGVWGWSIFAVEWFLAFLGIILYNLNYRNIKKIEVTLHILTGWVILAGLIPLIRSIPVISLILLLGGGAVYTMGTFWYRRKDVWGTHIVWHGFVLLGAICHWFSIWFIK